MSLHINHQCMDRMAMSGDRLYCNVWRESFTFSLHKQIVHFFFHSLAQQADPSGIKGKAKDLLPITDTNCKNSKVSFTSMWRKNPLSASSICAWPLLQFKVSHSGAVKHNTSRPNFNTHVLVVAANIIIFMVKSRRKCSLLHGCACNISVLKGIWEDKGKCKLLSRLLSVIIDMQSRMADQDDTYSGCRQCILKASSFGYRYMRSFQSKLSQALLKFAGKGYKDSV